MCTYAPQAPLSGPPGPDYGGNSSLNHEWVQLHNRSGSSINLANWTLRDKADRSVLEPFLVHIWNNTGDTATLESQHGTVIDQCSYQGTSQDYTYC
jgi:hypothetical protein